MIEDPKPGREAVEQTLADLLDGHRPLVVLSTDGSGRERIIHLAPGTSLTAASEVDLEHLLRMLGATTLRWSRIEYPTPYRTLQVRFASPAEADALVRSLNPAHRTMGKAGAIIERSRPTEEDPHPRGEALSTVIYFTTPALSQAEYAQLLALIPPNSTIGVEQEKLGIGRVEGQKLSTGEHRIGVRLGTPITSEYHLWRAASVLAARLELLLTHGQAEMELTDGWLLRLVEKFPGDIC